MGAKALAFAWTQWRQPLSSIFAAKRFSYLLALAFRLTTKLCFTLWLERPDLLHSISWVPDSSLSSLSVFRTQFFRFIRFSMNVGLSFRTGWRKWARTTDLAIISRVLSPTELCASVFSFLWSVTENWTTNWQAPLCSTLSLFQGFVLVYFQTSRRTLMLLPFSIERRWSSRTFRYGYLVTT